MYAFLWSLLPGPLWLRIALATIAAALVLLLLVTVVFPWVNGFVNAYEVTVH